MQRQRHVVILILGPQPAHWPSLQDLPLKEGAVVTLQLSLLQTHALQVQVRRDL
jgi:hypothetical protein